MIVLSIFAKEALAQQFPAPPAGVVFTLSHVEEPSVDNNWQHKAFATVSETEPGLVDWTRYSAFIEAEDSNGTLWASSPGVYLGSDSSNIRWTLNNINPSENYVLWGYFNQHISSGGSGAPVEWQGTSSIPYNSVGLTTGVQDLETSKLNVYPNPTSTDVVVTGFKDVDEQIFLFDLLGNVVLRVQTNKLEKVSIGLSELPAGMYILQTSKGSLKITKTGI